MRWLTLLLSLPPTPTRHRVGIWRKLKRIGALKLRGAAWILPETPETTELFQWLIQEVRTFRGEATLLRVDRIETMRDEELKALFHKERAAEYEVVGRGCNEIVSQLGRQRRLQPAALEPLKGRLEALKRELDRIRAIDYLDSPAGRRAAGLWETASKRLRAAEQRPRPAGSRHHAVPPPGSTWVTRPRPHIDRIASAWLIKRFIDPEAKFGFADEADVAKKGIPFDVLGAEYGHHGEDCTFETLLKRAGLKDRRLKVIAEIVHEADLHDAKFARPEARGVDLAVRGLATTIQEDEELLERGMVVFDGLYGVLKQKT